MKQKQSIRIALFSNPTFRVLLLFMVVVISTALLFSRLENITFFNAFYWIITTCSTVGYGDISPTTTATKILTMFIMISGVALLGYLLSTISNTFITLNMGKLMGLSRIKVSGHVIVAGWNVVGRIVTEELVKLGIKVVVVDEVQQSAISGMEHVNFVLGNCQEDNALKKAGVTRAVGIILAMESDAEVILAVSAIRKINDTITITGRIDDLDFSDVATQAGCNRVVSPSEIGGHMLASALFEPSVVRWFSEATVAHYGLDLADRRAEIENWAGKAIGDIDTEPGIRVVGIDRGSKCTVEALPEPTVVMSADDTLVTVVKNTGAARGVTYTTGKSKRVTEGDVFFIGWNPTVRSAVSELLFSKKYTISVLSDTVPVSELDHYEQLGVTFIQKDISKLSLSNALATHKENIIVGIEEDSDAILVAHIIRSLAMDINLIVRIDDPMNQEAAESIHANQVVSPSGIGGRLLAHAMDRPSSVAFLTAATTSTTGTDIEEYTVVSGDHVDGKKAVDFAHDTKTLVVGLDKNDKGIFISMPPDDSITSAGDTLVYLRT